jgi:cytochrome c oxidase subunit 1
MTFVGVYSIFMPMHWLGLLTQSHLFAEGQRAALASAGAAIRTFVTFATIWTVSAQGLFVWNFFTSLLGRKKSEQDNPWESTTLEWSVASPAPEDNFGEVTPTVYRGAYEFWAESGNFVPQHLPPEQLAQERQ